MINIFDGVALTLMKFWGRVNHYLGVFLGDVDISGTGTSSHFKPETSDRPRYSVFLTLEMHGI